MQNEFKKIDSTSSYNDIFEALREIACEKVKPTCPICGNNKDFTYGVCNRCHEEELVYSGKRGCFAWWGIEGNEESILLDDLDTYWENDVESEFKKDLDSKFNGTEILGYAYQASTILEKCEPSYFKNRFKSYCYHNILRENNPTNNNQCFIEIDRRYYKTHEVISLIKREQTSLAL